MANKLHCSNHPNNYCELSVYKQYPDWYVNNLTWNPAICPVGTWCEHHNKPTGAVKECDVFSHIKPDPFWQVKFGR